jgi:hypothetical protein
MSEETNFLSFLSAPAPTESATPKLTEQEKQLADRLLKDLEKEKFDIQEVHEKVRRLMEAQSVEEHWFDKMRAAQQFDPAANEKFAELAQKQKSFLSDFQRRIDEHLATIHKRGKSIEATQRIVKSILDDMHGKSSSRNPEVPMLGMHPGSLIRWWRVNVSNWTQAELATHATKQLKTGQLTQSTIQQLEVGRIRIMPYAEALERAMDLPQGWIALFRDNFQSRSRVINSGKISMRSLVNPFPHVFRLSSLATGNAVPGMDPLDSVFRKHLQNLQFTVVMEHDGFAQLPINAHLSCTNVLANTVVTGNYFVGIVNPKLLEIATARIFKADVSANGELRLMTSDKSEPLSFHDDTAEHAIYQGKGGKLSPNIKLVGRVVSVYNVLSPDFERAFGVDRDS